MPLSGIAYLLDPIIPFPNVSCTNQLTFSMNYTALNNAKL